MFGELIHTQYVKLVPLFCLSCAHPATAPRECVCLRPVSNVKTNTVCTVEGLFVFKFVFKFVKVTSFYFMFTELASPSVKKES